jgi:hypothetical protein
VTQAIELDLPSSISAEVHDNGIAVLSLSRAEKRNAIDVDVELTERSSESQPMRHLRGQSGTQMISR